MDSADIWRSPQEGTGRHKRMDNHSDAFVLFGATGDLAYKKISPAIFPAEGITSNYLRVRINPDVAIPMGMTVMAGGETRIISEPVEMVASTLPTAEQMDAYEKVLSDALAGDATLFAREDYVEEAWRIVDPVLGKRTVPHDCEPQTWGSGGSGGSGACGRLVQSCDRSRFGQ
jgi:glucose-6-phosphate 1-dehydrogenase